MNQRQQNARPINISVYHVVVNEPQSQPQNRNLGQKKYNPNSNNAGAVPKSNSYNQRPQNNHNANNNFNNGNRGASNNKNNTNNGYKKFNQGQKQFESTNQNAFTRSNSCRPQNNFTGNNVKFHNNLSNDRNLTNKNFTDGRNLHSNQNNFNPGVKINNQATPPAFTRSNSYKPGAQNNLNAQNISINYPQGNSTGKAFTRSNSCNIGAQGGAKSNDRNWKPKPKPGNKPRNTPNVNNITIVMDQARQNHAGPGETSTPTKQPSNYNKRQQGNVNNIHIVCDRKEPEPQKNQESENVQGEITKPQLKKPDKTKS